MKPGISAIVIVHNQVDLLKKCLPCLSWVDELIVVDLESTENVKAVASQFGAIYKKIPNVNIVEKVRQNSLEYATHEYVLFLDPDETIPETLSVMLKKHVKENKFDYFATARQNFVFGSWVKYSRWWPDYQVRLFKHGAVTWPQTLHGQPELRGESYRFPADPVFAITHQNYLSIDEWLDKNRRYASTDASDRLESGESYSLWIATKQSVSELMSRFFAGEGYRDGMHGLMLSILQSFYYFLVYAYYWEGKKYAELETPEKIKDFPRAWFSHALSETLFWHKVKSPIKNIKAKLVRRMIA